MATTTSSTKDAKQQLDFRDIHEFPPVDPSPVVPDPSWDAQKVYFNEFEKLRIKGDDFDDMFQEQTDNNVTESDLAIGILQKQQENNGVAAIADDRLDPLGWPREQSPETTDHAFQVDFDDDYKFPTELADGDEYNDEADLLGKEEKRSVTSTEDNKSVLVDDMCSNVSKLFCAGTNSSNEQPPPELKDTNEKVLSKEERIRMYENIGRDDESSVEEPDPESSSDEEDNNAEYKQQDDDESNCIFRQ